MRLVQVTVPAGQRQAVLDTLEEEGVDYVVTDEASGKKYTAVIYFPLPTNAVEDILDALIAAGLDEDAYTVVLDAETVVSRRFEELRERYEEDAESDSAIATAELKSKAEEFASNWRRYLTLTVVSAVIAAAGVLLDSAVVVVGANVIIPLMDPAMAASVGTVVRDRDLFVKGVKRQVAGLVVAVASAAAFAFVAKTVPLVPPNVSLFSIGQVRSGMTANALSLIVALGAGVAGAVTLVSGVSGTLVGVAIAVAIVPPAATMGIGIAWGNPAVVVGAGVLLLVNMLSINLAALVVLWRRGYRPQSFFETDAARETVLKRISVLVVGILVLSTFVGAVTLGTIHRASFEQHVGATVTDVLAEEPYDELVRLDVEVRYEREPFFRDPAVIVVTVGTPADTPHSDLAERLADRLSERVSGSVLIHVRFVELETARVT